MEDAGELVAHDERVLGGRPHRDALGVELRDAGVGLHRVVVDHREGEGVLEDVVRLGEAALHVAPVVVVLVAEVVGVDERAAGLERRQHVGHGRQLLVVDLDELDGGLGGLLVHCRDGRDRLALVPHLADGDDGTVLALGAVGLLHADELGAGQHGVDARQRPGAAGVDALDRGVRERARHELRVRHARQEDVAGVGCRTGDLFGPVLPLRRRANDLHHSSVRLRDPSALVPFVVRHSNHVASRPDRDRLKTSIPSPVRRQPAAVSTIPPSPFLARKGVIKPDTGDTPVPPALRQAQGRRRGFAPLHTPFVRRSGFETKPSGGQYSNRPQRRRALSRQRCRWPLPCREPETP